MTKLHQFFLIISISTLISCNKVADSKFDEFFTHGTMRIDYFHNGDASSEEIKMDKIYAYNQWAGSKKNLIDNLNYGTYYYKIYSHATDELIFSKGFDSYFKEYQMSTPAIDGIKKQIMLLND